MGVIAFGHKLKSVFLPLGTRYYGRRIEKALLFAPARAAPHPDPGRAVVPDIGVGVRKPYFESIAVAGYQFFAQSLRDILGSAIVANGESKASSAVLGLHMFDPPGPGENIRSTTERARIPTCGRPVVSRLPLKRSVA